MTSTTVAAPTSRRPSSIPTRIGLVLGGILSALQIQTGVGLWRAEGLKPDTAVLLLVPVVALIAIVFAWRGSFRARLVTVVACVVPALMGLPVYFISDIPPGAVLFVSIGIFWALVVAVLLLLPGRRSDPAQR
jgi:hypothetical protein